MSRRRKKHLSDEDAELWKRVTNTTKPLHPVSGPEKSERIAPVTKTILNSSVAVPVHPAPPKIRTITTVAPQPKLPKLMRKPSLETKIAQQPPNQHKIDRKDRTRIAKGRTSIDATLDLHGMTQAVAHQALRRFLLLCREADHRYVIVITGKGAAESGVLKTRVPDWLGHGEFAQYVNGFDHAGPRHGGSGALYVRIRRKRGR